MDVSIRTPRAETRRPLVAVEVRRSAWPALVFALVFLFAFVIPPFTPFAFPPYTALRWGDVIDLATPLVMLPAYWVMLSIDRVPGRWATFAFALAAGLWVEGHSMHLAANSIGHLLEAGPAAQLASFYDETLSHLAWHGAAIALSALLVLSARPWVDPGARTARAVTAAAAVVYGFAFFLIAVEGQTAALAVAGGSLVALLALRRGVRDLLARPVAAMFGGGYVVMLALLATWFLYWGGRLPEFSSLGLIR